MPVTRSQAKKGQSRLSRCSSSSSQSIPEELKKDVDTLFDCFKRGTSTNSFKKDKSKKISLQKEVAVCNKTSPQNIQFTENSSATRLEDRTPKKLQPIEVTPKPMKGKLNSTGKQISPGIFYGSPLGKSSKTPPRFWRLWHEIKTDLTEATDLTQRKAVWATFPRQEQAIQFAENHANVYLFCYQDHFTSQRRFLATTYEELWRRYSQMDARYRHHYEVIREGYPCHLYFDLEFDRKLNAEANGPLMVDLLLSVVSDAMRDIYGIQFEADWTVELDSSTTEKFSRHLIVRIPNAIFKDNLHVGAFVGEIRVRIADLQEKDSKYQQLCILKGDGNLINRSDLFVDSAVYSRNRCFRLAFSSKAGKNSFLLPTDRFKCKNMCRYEVFMESLISRKDQNCERLLTFGQEGIENRLNSTNDYYISAVPINFESRATSSAIFGRSPFPNLDAFVESISSIGDVPGRIRSWYWFSEYGVMLYNIIGNRFCENIGRQHKSNNVMYIVDFRTAGYYQKCHDPDCKGFRSPLRPIPEEIVPENFRRPTMKHENGNSLYYLQMPNDLNNQDMFSSSTTTENMCETDAWEDETWWEEVANTMEELELRTENLQTISKELDFQERTMNEDDQWWIEADLKASQFEQIYKSKEENFAL